MSNVDAVQRFMRGQGNTASEVERLKDALRKAADRFDDLAKILEDGGTYQNAGFLRASACRCRRAINGETFD